MRPSFPFRPFLLSVWLLLAAPALNALAVTTPGPGERLALSPESFATPEPLPEELPEPTPEPSPLPTPRPTALPTPRPTTQPTAVPTARPSPHPTASPGSWVKPIEAVLMNPFGNSYPFYGSLRSGHTGVDLAAPVGTAVHAVADGSVVRVVTTPNMRYGNYLVIRHAQAPYHTLYGHLSQIRVRPGQKVKAGELIGKSGISGLASYPHLHFEVIDRLPVYDGAWGYRYICNGGTVWLQMQDGRRLGHVAGIPWLDEYIGFVGAHKQEMHSFLRMSKGQCREMPIAPITYFNPQDFLPPYASARMPDLSGGH